MATATAAIGPVGSAPPVVVQVRELTRRFGSLIAVDRVSFDIAAGESFALVGPNGAGKSTLMKMLTTLLPPTSGRARVSGHDIVEAPGAVRAGIGYVPQQLSADGELTGFENLWLSARLYLVPRAQRRSRIAEALELMDLADAKDRLVRTYSGGMARRLEIAQSTLHRPAVLFMDEPTVGLDPVGRRAVWNHMQGLREQLGIAVVFSTHYMDEVEEVGDRLAVIDHGRIVALGPPAELKARHAAESLDDVFSVLTGAPSLRHGERPR